MAVAATVKVVLGLIAFGVFWVLAVFPAVPFLPIGRTAGSLLGAMLMVVFQVLTPDQAYEAIDLSILGLLFGTMVVSIYLERAEMFKYLGQMLAWKSIGPRDLLCRICLITAVASALFTNDTCCVVLTEFVLKVARQHNLPPHPFLLALATSANIGSAATPIGNPQNLVIAIESGISFGEFLIGILPAVLVGVVVNIIFLTCMYWKLLSSPQKDEEYATEEVLPISSVELSKEIDIKREEAVPSKETSSSLEEFSEPEQEDFSTKCKRRLWKSLVYAITMTLWNSRVYPVPSKETYSSLEEFSEPEQEDFSTKCKRLWRSRVYAITRRLWKSRVYAITLGMLAALLAGLDMSWSTITAAIVLVVLDFKDARPCLDKVSYSLLVFFCGMFITVDGFNKTGIPTALWDKLEPYANVTSVAGTTILSVVILVLSNLASNVPTVLLLGSQVVASAAAVSTAEEKKAWLILAWVSTVAGNLSLLGSAANLIVCEQAGGGQFPNNLSFWSHLKFGLPSTIIITAVGLTHIR